MVGPSHFLSGSTTIQSLQNGEKMGEKRRKSVMVQNCPSPSHDQFFVFLLLSFRSFFVLFLFFVFFCLNKISSSLHNTFTLVLFFFIYFFIFFMDKILHSRCWFFLFVCFFFLISFWHLLIL